LLFHAGSIGECEAFAILFKVTRRLIQGILASFHLLRALDNELDVGNDTKCLGTAQLHRRLWRAAELSARAVQ